MHLTGTFNIIRMPLGLSYLFGIRQSFPTEYIKNGQDLEVNGPEPV